MRSNGRDEMYSFTMGPILYDRTRDGVELSLVDCVRAVYGVGDARVLRAVHR
jgi:hypothetical protein